MLILASIKTFFTGCCWWLLAGCLLLLWGLVGQWFVGQPCLLNQTEHWLEHEKILLSKLTGTPITVQSVSAMFDANVLPKWQRINHLQLLTIQQAKRYDKKPMPLATVLVSYRERLLIAKTIFCNLLEVVWLRYRVVLLFLPLFGLLGFVGFVDGLVQRHLRKHQGARESSVLYQRIKEGLKPSLFGAGVLYVGMPTCLNPTPLFLTFALLFGVVFTIAARTYKKYL